MRVLFVTAAYLPESIGGVELHVRGLARALRAKGHHAAVFCRGADPARQEFSLERYEHDGVPVARLDYKFSDCASFEGILRSPGVRKRFEEALAELRPDVVHFHHLTCLSTDLVDAARAAGIRTVLTLHDFWMGCPRGQRMTPELDLCADIDLERCVPCLTKMWSGWFGEGRDGPGVPAAQRHARDLAQMRSYHEEIRGVLLRVDALVTPSASSRQIFGRQGVPVEKIRVVENGLDHAPFRGVQRRTTGNRFRFGVIGSVLPTKGVHVAVQAMGAMGALAERGRPELGGREDCELHVHGVESNWHEVTGYGERLRALAAPLHDRVRFHGRYEADAVPRILASLDALIVPSLWFEAFCLTLREGFLAGVPCIVSDLGAMREAVEDGVTGLLFAPGDASDLAAKMRRLMDDPALRARLAGSPKRVRTIEDNAEELLAIYYGARAESAA